MIAILIVAIVILIILSGLFSSADMVYAVVNRLRLKKDIEKNNSKSEKVALKFSEEYNETITTILFSNNLVNIAATSLATILGYKLFTEQPLYDLSPTIMSVILLVVLLIFGEILPKVMGRAFSYRLSKLFAYPLLVIKYLFFPIVFVTSKFGELLAKPFLKKEENKEEEELFSDDELDQMIETIKEEGIIDEDQKELIRSALIFKDTEAHEIMTPRVDIFAIDIDDDNIGEVIFDDEFYKFSRIPVFKGDLDNILGVIQTKEILRMMLAKEKITRKVVEEKLIAPIYVPFSMGVSEILENMQRTKNHIVFIIDEYGGIAGLLTMEDILEELVGEIFDEMDKTEELLKKISRNQYEVSGDFNIDDFFDLLGVEKEDDLDVSTVSGYVTDKLERFAKEGDKFRVGANKIEVIAASDFTVDKVLVKLGRKKK